MATHYPVPAFSDVPKVNKLNIPKWRVAISENAQRIMPWLGPLGGVGLVEDPQEYAQDTGKPFELLPPPRSNAVLMLTPAIVDHTPVIQASAIVVQCCAIHTHYIPPFSSRYLDLWWS